jgi:hypothetical protein
MQENAAIYRTNETVALDKTHRQRCGLIVFLRAVINRLTRSLTASSSVSTGIGERVLREQRMSEMNERLNDGSKVQVLVEGSSVGSRSAKELVHSNFLI